MTGNKPFTMQTVTAVNPRSHAELDYIDIARKSGLQGQRGRDVEASVRKAVKNLSDRLKVKITITNKPGTILETSHGSYKVMRNGMLLALRPDSKMENEINSVVKSVLIPEIIK